MTKNSKKLNPLKIVLIAIGGDGGGVLTQWIIKMAESEGYWAQSTSIAGVAQRTGSTVYYIEAIPIKDITLDGKIQTPVLAQMPGPYDVDIVMTTELLEVGRAIQRKFVSDKTTVVFSTHRNLAIKEKEAPGDGISKGQQVFDMVNKHAKKCYHANLKLIADKNKSVISASLFGALAASKSTPFSKETFLNTIEKGGIAVKQSTAAFEEAYHYVTDSANQAKPFNPELAPKSYPEMPSSVSSKKINDLIQKIKAEFPEALHKVLYTSVTHLADWQNEKYAHKYLEMLSPFVALDEKHPNKQYELSHHMSRYLAIALSYDDLIFVADQKTRTERFAEMYDQVDAKQNDLVHTLDYLHPSFDEVTGFMPKKLGKKLERSQGFKSFFNKYLDKDRRMYSTNFFGFMMLYVLGGMKKWRLKTLRHHEEMNNVAYWLKNIEQVVDKNYNLAVQIAKTYRLKKGYGCTYERGDSKFSFINEFAIKYQNKDKVDDYAEYLIDFGLQNHDVKAMEKKIAEIEPVLN